MSYTVNNIGSRSSNVDYWYDKIYIGSVLNPASAYQIGNVRRSTNINPGESYTETVNIVIPGYLIGNYYLMVVADGSNSVFEFEGEGNNLSYAVVSVKSPDPSDLIISSVSTPADVILGEDVNIEFTIQNAGSNRAVGYVDDAAYLSEDISFDGTGDNLLTIEKEYVDLNPGETTTRLFTEKLTGVLPGNYYGVGRTNIRNTILETELDNNIGFSAETVEVTVNELALETTESFPLDMIDRVYYKVVMEADLDLLITLTYFKSGLWFK